MNSQTGDLIISNSNSDVGLLIVILAICGLVALGAFLLFYRKMRR